MVFKEIAIATLLLSLLTTACATPEQNKPVQNNGSQQSPVTPKNPVNHTNQIRRTFIMKGVGINIPANDFLMMKDAGITILTTEWGMEQSTDKVNAFLDKANVVGLKVVMDGGFSDSAWGFTEDDWDNLAKGKKPVWQKHRVQDWVRAFKNHPAVLAWDICNEYGENLPSGAHAKNSEWPQTAITLEQLKQARNDVREIDSSRPILVRTFEWDLDEPPFGLHRPFEAGIAEIVMLNLYSNYLEKGRLQWPSVIEDVGEQCVKAVRTIDPNAKIWISISAFEQTGLFQKPTVTSLTRDIETTLGISNIDGIAFFAWGPTYAEPGNQPWYLPERGSDLWEAIKHDIR
jgi:hypothetical protein